MACDEIVGKDKPMFGSLTDHSFPSPFVPVHAYGGIITFCRPSSVHADASFLAIFSTHLLSSATQQAEVIKLSFESSASVSIAHLRLE